MLKTLKYCYDELGERDNFELFLIRASQQINNTKVDLMLASVIEEKDGKRCQRNQNFINNSQNIQVHLFSTVLFNSKSMMQRKGEVKKV